MLYNYDITFNCSENSDLLVCFVQRLTKKHYTSDKNLKSDIYEFF